MAKKENAADVVEDGLLAGTIDPTVDADQESKDEDNLNIYELDPKKCDPRIIVNVLARPMILPKGKMRNSSTTLKKGDRIFGEYYKRIVTDHKVPGLQQCCVLSKPHLEELDNIRKLRTGEEPEQWIKEAWALKDDTVGRKITSRKR